MVVKYSLPLLAYKRLIEFDALFIETAHILLVRTRQNFIQSNNQDLFMHGKLSSFCPKPMMIEKSKVQVNYRR